MTGLATLLRAVEETTGRPSKRHAAGYLAVCPAHDDRSPSLSLREGDNGKPLVKCHAGCRSDDVIAALGLGWPELLSERQTDKGSWPAGVTVVQLADAKCLPVDFLHKLGVEDRPGGVRICYRLKDGSDAPRQRIRTELVAKDGSRWDGKRGDSIVPYGLWRLAENQEDAILLVEGESDAWAAWYHGIAALGVPGANMAKVLTASMLEGCKVVQVWQEPDRGGEAFVRGIKARFEAVGWRGEAFVLKPPDALKDVADLHRRDPDGFITAFGEIAEAAEPLALCPERTSGIQLLDLDAPPPSVEYLIDDIVEVGGITFLAGDQGTLKSYSALDLIVSILLKEAWLGRFPVHLRPKGDGTGGIVYVEEENGASRIYQRLEWLTGPRELTPGDLKPALTISPKQGITDADPERWKSLVELIAEKRPALIIFDTLRAIFSGDENDSGEAQEFLRKLYQLQAVAGNAAILILCHPGKDKVGIRGSSRWPQAADMVINLTTLPGRGTRKKLSWSKVRDGFTPSPVGIVLREVPGGISLQLTAMSKAEQAREFHHEHPDWSHQAIAELVGCDRSTVTRALGNDGDGGDGD